MPTTVPPNRFNAVVVCDGARKTHANRLPNKSQSPKHITFSTAIGANEKIKTSRPDFDVGTDTSEI